MANGAMTEQRGFSLVELVAVIVLTAILAAGAAITLQPRGGTAPYQAERLAQDLRHTQALAMSWGAAIRLTAAGGSYSVRCVTLTGTPPCSNNPVIDPATGSAFTVALQDGASFSAGGSITFDSFGVPLNGANPAAADQTLQLGDGTVTASVTVAALSGFVSSTP